MPRDLTECLSLDLGPMGLEATLKIEPGFSMDEFTEEAVLAYLDSKGIRAERIDRDALNILMAGTKLNPGAPASLAVAKGVPPVDPAPERVVLSDEIIELRTRVEQTRAEAAHAPGEDADPDQSDEDHETDHYDRPGFVILKAGDAVGTVVPETEGADGEDIYGGVINARSRPTDVQAIGPGLRRAGDNSLLASRGGVLEITDKSIDVSDTLHIEGNVDFSTGNIRFPGDVEITRCVRDRFLVEASRSVRVGEIVEAATIRCGGSLTIGSGMAGRERGRVEVEREFHAKYLKDMSGVVHGDCTVDREICGCSLEVSGDLHAESAVVRGGELRVSRAADVGSLGGAGGIVTAVVLGGVDELDSVVRELDEIREPLTRSAEDAERKLSQISEQIADPTASQAEELTELQFELENSTRRLHRLDEAAERVQGVYARASSPVLRVQSSIHEKTTVWLPGWRVEIDREIAGPLELGLGPDARPALTVGGEAMAQDNHFSVHPDDRVPGPPPSSADAPTPTPVPAPNSTSAPGIEAAGAGHEAGAKAA